MARDDIAEAIVAVLLGDGLDGRTYGVTASDAITIHEAAEKRSLVTGRSITYHAETLEEAYASRTSYGAPEWEIKGWVTSYAAIANGEMNVVSDTVSEPTGHAPMTITDFLRRYPESYQHLLNK